MRQPSSRLNPGRDLIGISLAITRAVAAEARANPDGRFAVMTRLGFVPILHARLASRR